MANLISKIHTELYQNWPRFVKDMTKTFLVRFSVHSCNCCSLAEREYYVLQGSVETLLRQGEKRLHYCMANLLRTIHAKFY